MSKSDSLSRKIEPRCIIKWQQIVFMIKILLYVKGNTKVVIPSYFDVHGFPLTRPERKEQTHYTGLKPFSFWLYPQKVLLRKERNEAID